MSQKTAPSQGTWSNHPATLPQVGSCFKKPKPRPSDARSSMMNPRYASRATYLLVVVCRCGGLFSNTAGCTICILLSYNFLARGFEHPPIDQSCRIYRK